MTTTIPYHNKANWTWKPQRPSKSQKLFWKASEPKNLQKLYDISKCTHFVDMLFRTRMKHLAKTLSTKNRCFLLCPLMIIPCNYPPTQYAIIILRIIKITICTFGKSQSQQQKPSTLVTMMNHPGAWWRGGQFPRNGCLAAWLQGACLYAGTNYTSWRIHTDKNMTDNSARLRVVRCGKELGGQNWDWKLQENGGNCWDGTFKNQPPYTPLIIVGILLGISNFFPA